jgi:CRISPR-associated endoribonuclease Cas6
MGAGWSFEVMAVRAQVRPAARLVFPANAAVPIRGALGFVLPEEHFRPRRTSGPSGLRDVPRPFVLRVRHLDGRTFEAGESFQIGLNLFAPGLEQVFEKAVREMARTGLGAGRVGLAWEGWNTVVRTFDLRAGEPCEELAVSFLTPTELKGWDGVGLPPFAVLAARARDRVSALQAAYGGGEPALDFRGLGERARAVRAVAGSLENVQGSRKSARTGQTHPLAGFRGTVRYAGELGEFVPLLRAACCTGIGRQTVWGHGEIGVEPPVLLEAG